jgi:glycosyltransferase involved in cell wall biosynthesis
MKVALYGNVCNNFYSLAKSLREFKIAEAHLYLNDKVDLQNRPENDDPQLLNNYPSWIHLHSSWDPFALLKKFDRTFVNELNKYDVVFLSDLGVILAPYIKSRTIFYVTGGDLTRIPFTSRYMQEFRGVKSWLIRSYISFMQRRGIKNCDMIITQPFMPFRSALNKLQVNGKRVSKSYYPLLIDTDSIRYTAGARDEIDMVNKEKLKPFNFILFHPSRLFIEKKKNYVEMGVWKGNDNLFQAFAIFLRKYNVTDACIALPERIHSPDISLAKQLISDFGIERNTVWLKPSSEEGFARNELVKFYSLSDIVADEFATGWFGSIVVEGLACGKPTFCYVDDDVMKTLYPWHPIISASEPEAIAERIAEFYFDKQKAKAQGDISRQWAVEFHSLKYGTNIYVNNFRKDLKEVFTLD